MLRRLLVRDVLGRFSWRWSDWKSVLVRISLYYGDLDFWGWLVYEGFWYRVYIHRSHESINKRRSGEMLV